jgi:hypothetical protein
VGRAGGRDRRQTWSGVAGAQQWCRWAESDGVASVRQGIEGGCE